MPSETSGGSKVPLPMYGASDAPAAASLKPLYSSLSMTQGVATLSRSRRRVVSTGASPSPVRARRPATGRSVSHRVRVVQLAAAAQRKFVRTAAEPKTLSLSVDIDPRRIAFHGGASVSRGSSVVGDGEEVLVSAYARSASLSATVGAGASVSLPRGFYERMLAEAEAIARMSAADVRKLVGSRRRTWRRDSALSRWRAQWLASGRVPSMAMRLAPIGSDVWGPMMMLRKMASLWAEGRGSLVGGEVVEVMEEGEDGRSVGSEDRAELLGAGPAQAWATMTDEERLLELTAALDDSTVRHLAAVAGLSPPRALQLESTDPNVVKRKEEFVHWWIHTPDGRSVRADFTVRHLVDVANDEGVVDDFWDMMDDSEREAVLADAINDPELRRAATAHGVDVQDDVDDPSDPSGKQVASWGLRAAAFVAWFGSHEATPARRAFLTKAFASGAQDISSDLRNAAEHQDVFSSLSSPSVSPRPASLSPPSSPNNHLMRAFTMGVEVQRVRDWDDSDQSDNEDDDNNNDLDDPLREWSRHSDRNPQKNIPIATKVQSTANGGAAVVEVWTEQDEIEHVLPTSRPTSSKSSKASSASASKQQKPKARIQTPTKTTRNRHSPIQRPEPTQPQPQPQPQQRPPSPIAPPQVVQQTERIASSTASAAAPPTARSVNPSPRPTPREEHESEPVVPPIKPTAVVDYIHESEEASFPSASASPVESEDEQEPPTKPPTKPSPPKTQTPEKFVDTRDTAEESDRVAEESDDDHSHTPPPPPPAKKPTSSAPPPPKPSSAQQPQNQQDDSRVRVEASVSSTIVEEKSLAEPWQNETGMDDREAPPRDDKSTEEEEEEDFVAQGDIVAEDDNVAQDDFVAEDDNKEETTKKYIKEEEDKEKETTEKHMEDSDAYDKILRSSPSHSSPMPSVPEKRDEDADEEFEEVVDEVSSPPSPPVMERLRSSSDASTSAYDRTESVHEVKRMSTKALFGVPVSRHPSAASSSRPSTVEDDGGGTLRPLASDASIGVDRSPQGASMASKENKMRSVARFSTFQNWFARSHTTRVEFLRRKREAMAMRVIFRVSGRLRRWRTLRKRAASSGPMYMHLASMALEELGPAERALEMLSASVDPAVRAAAVACGVKVPSVEDLVWLGRLGPKTLDRAMAERSLTDMATWDGSGVPPGEAGMNGWRPQTRVDSGKNAATESAATRLHAFEAWWGKTPGGEMARSAYLCREVAAAVLDEGIQQSAEEEAAESGVQAVPTKVRRSMDRLWEAALLRMATGQRSREDEEVLMENVVQRRILGKDTSKKGDVEEGVTPRSRAWLSRRGSIGVSPEQVALAKEGGAKKEARKSRRRWERFRWWYQSHTPQAAARRFAFRRARAALAVEVAGTWATALEMAGGEAAVAEAARKERALPPMLRVARSVGDAWEEAAPIALPAALENVLRPAEDTELPALPPLPDGAADDVPGRGAMKRWRPPVESCRVVGEPVPTLAEQSEKMERIVRLAGIDLWSLSDADASVAHRHEMQRICADWLATAAAREEEERRRQEEEERLRREAREREAQEEAARLAAERRRKELEEQKRREEEAAQKRAEEERKRNEAQEAERARLAALRAKREQEELEREQRLKEEQDQNAARAKSKSTKKPKHPSDKDDLADLNLLEHGDEGVLDEDDGDGKEDEDIGDDKDSKNTTGFVEVDEDNVEIDVTKSSIPRTGVDELDAEARRRQLEEEERRRREDEERKRREEEERLAREGLERKRREDIEAEARRRYEEEARLAAERAADPDGLTKAERAAVEAERRRLEEAERLRREAEEAERRRLEEEEERERAKWREIMSKAARLAAAHGHERLVRLVKESKRREAELFRMMEEEEASRRLNDALRAAQDEKNLLEAAAFAPFLPHFRDDDDWPVLAPTSSTIERAIQKPKGSMFSFRSTLDRSSSLLETVSKRRGPRSLENPLSHAERRALGLGSASHSHTVLPSTRPHLRLQTTKHLANTTKPPKLRRNKEPGAPYLPSHSLATSSTESIRLGPLSEPRKPRQSSSPKTSPKLESKQPDPDILPLPPSQRRRRRSLRLASSSASAPILERLKPRRLDPIPSISDSKQPPSPKSSQQDYFAPTTPRLRSQEPQIHLPPSSPIHTQRRQSSTSPPKQPPPTESKSPDPSKDLQEAVIVIPSQVRILAEKRAWTKMEPSPKPTPNATPRDPRPWSSIPRPAGDLASKPNTPSNPTQKPHTPKPSSPPPSSSEAWRRQRQSSALAGSKARPLSPLPPKESPEHREVVFLSRQTDRPSSPPPASLQAAASLSTLGSGWEHNSSISNLPPNQQKLPDSPTRKTPATTIPPDVSKDLTHTPIRPAHKAGSASKPSLFLKK